jgi:hypothetical protein
MRLKQLVYGKILQELRQENIVKYETTNNSIFQGFKLRLDNLRFHGSAHGYCKNNAMKS